MKKMLFLLVLGNLLLATMAHAASQTSPHNLFNDDIHAWDCNLEALSELEQFVETANLTHAELKQQNHPLLPALFDSYSVEGILFDPENPNQQYLNVPGFIWGFCCSVVGVLIVNLFIDDSDYRKNQTSSAIAGCIASCLLGGCVLVFIPLIYGAY